MGEAVLEAEIKEFETRHGIQLPKEYRDVMYGTDMAFLASVLTFTLPDTGEACHLQGFFSGAGLTDVRERYGHLMPKDVVAVGHCHNGDLLCLGVHGSAVGQVYLWHAEAGLKKSGWGNLTRLSSSYKAFVSGLVIEERWTLAWTVMRSFGGDYEVYGFKEPVERDPKDIEVLQTFPTPEHNLIMASTLGLFETPTGQPYDDKPIRVELVSLVENKHDFMKRIPAMLAACAFELMRSTLAIGPGIICEQVFGHMRSRMEHVLLVPQYLWDDLHPVDFPKKEVRWLLAVPISERERRYALKHGVGALNDLLSEHNINVSDLKRKPVV